MIDSLVVHVPSGGEENLITNLVKHCPLVRIKGVAHTSVQALSLISTHKPGLLFLDAHMEKEGLDAILNVTEHSPCKTILFGDCAVPESTYSRTSISALVQSPRNVADLVLSVRNALAISETPSHVDQSAIHDTVGIPTMGGFEYIKVARILRCEGLQKCTRVVTSDRKNIISAYPVGAFKSLLIPFGFYDVHRSHLINLSRVIRCTREGFIVMDDGSSVPLARRKRAAFLAQWKQL